MNTYNFDLSGNILILILLVLIGFGLTFYTYTRTNPPIGNKIRSLLIFLRTLALTLLLILLFQPILSRINVTEKEPKIGVLIDNSSSMILDDASGNRKEILNKIFQNNDLNELFEKSEFMLFDSETEIVDDFNYDSLEFNGSYTDISQSIRQISRIAEDENIRSLLMITDGSFNKGGNPLYDAEKFGKPIDIIAVGDTNQPKDIAITNIITNDITFRETTVPVNINFESHGYSGDSIDITLYENNEVIDSKTLRLEDKQIKYSEFFRYKPETTGNIRLTARISPLENEITTNNNSISKFVEVRDNKRVISIFAGYPYPDISFLKKALEKNDAYEIREFIQKNNSAFYNSPSDKDFSETDVFVLTGFPIFSTPNSIIEKIKEQAEIGKSILFIAGSETDYSKLRILEPVLPFNTSSVQKREYQARAKFHSEKMSDPFLRYDGKILDSKLWNELPPVFRSELFVSPKPDAEILASVIVNNVELNEPFIIKRNFQEQRTTAILGYGIYRWKLNMDKDEEYDLFTNLINNTITWLNVSNIDKNVDFNTSKNFYSGNESIEITAQVYDDALNPLDDALVSAEISDTSSYIRNIQLSSIGSGRYFAQIDELPPGEYSFAGKAEFDDNIIGEDSGRFSVGEINTEYLDITMNYNLLKNISSATNGITVLPSNIEKLSDIDKRNEFRPFPVTNKTDYSLWTLPLILSIVILLFAVEWIIRKRKGLI